MNLFRCCFICALFIGVSLALPAQTKFEREYRVKEKDVPDQAKSIVQGLFSNQKIKWYGEESQDGKSIEAKLKFKGYHYSIEFDTLGNFQDIEKTIDFDDLDRNITDVITEALTKEFGDFKILKTQIQWTPGDIKMLKELLENDSLRTVANIKYEIIVEARIDKAYRAFEVLLDRVGVIEKSLEIDFRSMNNMEF